MWSVRVYSGCREGGFLFHVFISSLSAHDRWCASTYRRNEPRVLDILKTIMTFFFCCSCCLNSLSIFLWITSTKGENKKNGRILKTLLRLRKNKTKKVFNDGLCVSMPRYQEYLFFFLFLLILSSLSPQFSIFFNICNLTYVCVWVSKVFLTELGILRRNLENMRGTAESKGEKKRPPTVVVCQFLFLVSTRVIFTGVERLNDTQPAPN